MKMMTDEEKEAEKVAQQASPEMPEHDATFLEILTKGLAAQALNTTLDMGNSIPFEFGLMRVKRVRDGAWVTCLAVQMLGKRTNEAGEVSAGLIPVAELLPYDAVTLYEPPTPGQEIMGRKVGDQEVKVGRTREWRKEQMDS